MIFSGQIQSRNCEACKVEFSRVTPTSILFFVFLLGAGFALVMPLFAELTDRRWLAVVAAISATIAWLVLLLWGAGALNRRLNPMPDTCPKCGVEMRRGGGFYDFGLIPTGQEILVAVVYVGVFLLLRIDFPELPDFDTSTWPSLPAWLNIPRWIVGVPLLALGALVSLQNWGAIIHTTFTRESASFIPVVGGLLAFVGLLIIPLPGRLSWIWVPFVADFGCLPMGVGLLIGAVVGCFRKKGGKGGET
jgi:hypothetical protein